MNRYSYSKHPHDNDQRSDKSSYNPAVISEIEKLNRLDMLLYERAQEIFESRFSDMLAKIPQQQSMERFQHVSGSNQYILKDASLIPPKRFRAGGVPVVDERRENARKTNVSAPPAPAKRLVVTPL